MYFDSHAHLDDGRFQEDFDDILARMKENGVTAMMNIGCDLPSSENSVRLAQTYDWIWAAVGSHPDDADHVDAARIEVYRALCKSPRAAMMRAVSASAKCRPVPGAPQIRITLRAAGRSVPSTKGRRMARTTLSTKASCPSTVFLTSVASPSKLPRCSGFVSAVPLASRPSFSMSRSI